MGQLGLAGEMVDASVYGRALERFRSAGIVMPTFSQLADPSTIPAAEQGVAGIG